MDELHQRMAHMEAQIQALQGAVSNAILLATSATGLAYSLAATHPSPSDLITVFKAVSATLEGHETYSQASDEQVTANNRRSEEVIAFLEKLVAPPPDAPRQPHPASV
jgi:pyruvate kinase